MTTALADAVRKGILACLWTAGINEDDAMRRRVSGEAIRSAPEGIDLNAIVKENVADALEHLGLKVDRNARMPRLLGVAKDGAANWPDAGHVVRLTAPWSGLPPGETLRLVGRRGSGLLHLGGGLTQWNGDIVRQTSGHGSALAIHKSALTRTADIAEARYWRFMNGIPAANEGVQFLRLVPVWEWDGDETDFVSERRAA